MAHERGTLEAVINARNQAASATQSAAKNPADAKAMQALLGAESALTSSLGKLFALMENYPNLKADQTMSSLMEELSSTENKVAFARQAYNDAVMVYNIQIESFPDVLVAKNYHFEAATLFEIENEEERSAVKVKF